MPKKKLKAEPAIMRYYPEKDYVPESKPFYLYEDKDYKPEAKPFPLYDNETLESKRKGGMTKNLNTKVKKAYLGKAIRQPTETDTEFEIRHEYHTPFKGPQKASLGALIGIGADNLLKKSETARSLTKNLGIGGNLLGSYYDKKTDTKDKATGQVTAKKRGGPVKKAFGGMFKKSSTATPSGGGSGGGDQLNSVLGALLGSKFGRGLQNKNITYSSDTSGQTTGGKQTGQVTAKRMGGEVIVGKGKDYIKDLL